MKHLYFFTFVLFLASCRKEQAPLQQPYSLTDAAFQFLQTELPLGEYERLDKTSWQILTIRGRETGIKIFENGSGEIILLQKTPSGFSGNRAAISGVVSSKEHSGTIILKSLSGDLLKKYNVDHNKVTGQQLDLSQHAGQNFKDIEMPPVVIESNRAISSLDYLSLYWLFGGSISNYYYYYTPNYKGGGGGGSNNGAVAAPAMYSPDRPLPEVKEEMKCFTVSSTASYTVTVNVNQPVPGSRDVFDPIAAFPVGHTFLTLKQVNADGSMIIRNVGYYPKNIVKPGSTTDAATYGDDSNTPYDVSLQISVSGADFMTLISNIVFQQKLTYDLDNFNCTGAAISTLQSININLPATRSGSLFFGGVNPADLGEDIRGLDLNTFSTNNGGRKVVRTASNDNNQKPPAKAGGC